MAKAEPSSAKEALRTRKWLRELAIAGKREKDWRDTAEKNLKRYRNEERKRNRFNVLWSNTQVLRPSLYNSKPNPDVRRRFRDADPVGKAVAEVLERSLYVMADGDDFDGVLRNDVFDALVPGRGISRIRYVPSLKGKPAEKPDIASTADDEGVGGSQPPADAEGSYEQVEFEQAIAEHVDWHDFRHGFGRVWSEVPWVGFRHKLTREDATKLFGKKAIVTVKFSQPLVEEERQSRNDTGETTKVAEFWEIWDKEGAQVFFLCEQCEYRLFPLDNLDGEPPLDFDGFFPCPQPLMVVENTSSLMPLPMFQQYEDQANEIDKLTARISRIIDGCRLRGVYDGRVKELADLFDSDDNDMTPVQNAQQWADAGGLEKAMAFAPVDKVVQVLETLYEAREKLKQSIDELIGISDIVRGATDPNETLGAQNLKSNYYSVRLDNMRNEVKRYARELIRLASQVMASKFGPDTFAAVTDLKFPTKQEKLALQGRAQMMQQPQPGPPGAPPAPPPQLPPELEAALRLPAWEDIIGLMRSPAMRQFRVDVETDSMVAGTLEGDMAGLSQVLKAIAETLTGLAPLVQSQALPVDAAKEIVMAVIRRARLGLAVEDAFDKMQMPQPPPDKQAAESAGRIQEIQAKGDTEIKVAQIKAQLDGYVADAQQRAQAQQNAQEQALEAHRTEQKQQFDMFQARLDAAVKLLVAQINATKAADPQAGPVAESDYARQQ